MLCSAVCGHKYTLIVGHAWLIVKAFRYDGLLRWCEWYRCYTTIIFGIL